MNFHDNAQQAPGEVVWLLPHILGAKRILEIGSMHGDMLRAMATACRPGAIIRSIDLPGEDGPKASEDNLHRAHDELQADGFDVEIFLGNSRSKSAINWARAWAPYDFIFIDGDHSYEGTKADWENYGPMGRLVGFHDIQRADLGCGKMWDEIAATHKVESISLSPNYM